MNREDLQTSLINRIIDGMDMESLRQCATEYLSTNYDGYTDEQLKTEATEYYPELLED